VRLAGLTLRQPETGYRFSLDPFLLAAFARPRAAELVLDAGAGVGVIALLLASRHPRLTAVALEIQPSLARHALENARVNGLAGRCLVVRADLRDAASMFPAGSFHRVVANPPYRARAAGRASPDPSRALARQESTFTIAALAAAAAAILRHGGTLDMIHLSERLPEIFGALSRHGLEPKVLRLVAPSPGSTPRLCLVSARKGGRPGLETMPTLTVHGAPGVYAPEVAACLGEGDTPTPRRVKKSRSDK
jgi:tRNA1Val (adenine37-N6)-methyltransferase